MHKVLIIKTGYSETFDGGISITTSYGDVLRTTVLLNLYKNDEVTWLIDEKAYPIIKNNPYIKRPMIYNLSSCLQLERERFDTVINLEKVPGLCALADSIKAWRRYGFRFNEDAGTATSYDGTHDVLQLCYDGNRKKTYKKYWQQMLFEMVGNNWNGEEYVFGYQYGEPTIDIGLNQCVGTKWPTKGWDSRCWMKLHDELLAKHTVSWQNEGYNMEEYFKWIASCKTIITNDSFGLHIALAMKRNVVVLFTSTNPNETYLYDRGIALWNNVCDKQPCCLSVCDNKICNVDVGDVIKAVDKIYG